MSTSPPPASPSPAPSGDVPETSATTSGTSSPAPPSDLPLTMSASVVLADLPRSAADALQQTAASTGPQADRKVIVRFKAVGSAPVLAQDVCKISGARRFEEVVRYLRRKLRCRETDSVFLYVNSAFAPSLDEVVGNLHQCFKNSHDQLVVAYSMTPAFG
ncbi:Ubiquitin-like protein [Lecanicillium sp. MT-2017a]|nr:Ubiquitin-like protein [Lecanicillium sp. MT-2017a]